MGSKTMQVKGGCTRKVNRAQENASDLRALGGHLMGDLPSVTRGDYFANLLLIWTVFFQPFLFQNRCLN